MTGTPPSDHGITRERLVRVGQSNKVHIAHRTDNGGWQTRCGYYASQWRYGYWMQTASGANTANCLRCQGTSE